MREQTKRHPRRVLAAIGALALVGAMTVGGQFGATPAYALDLPTWDDVQAAKANSAAAAAKVSEIEGLISAGQVELERLRNAHADAVAAFEKAEAEFMTAAQKSATLDAQAKESAAAADVAADQAASLVSQMYRSGGVDRNLELFLETDGDTADLLLERLASMSRATERNTAISDEAERAMNTAKSLGEQADVARAEREKLREQKDQLQQEAAVAVASQSDAVAKQENDLKVLDAQLAALKDTESSTVAGYQERLRVEEEIRQEQIRQAEAERLAREEAARKAAEDAANAGGGGGGGGGTGGGGGGGSSTGWYAPISYRYISTYFQQWWGHTGVDLVNGCGTPIIAPNSGTISFVGWHDNTGGNMIYLNHGGNYQTRFAHLSGFNVSYGQWVQAGQLIGYVGTTGASTGCHLHYEVLSGGIFIDPLSNGFV